MESNTPTIYVVFGITGDLAQRKILPGLLRLFVERRLPKQCAIVGFGRRPFNREEFRAFLRENMQVKITDFHGEDVKHFLDIISYVQGQFADEMSYKLLSSHLKMIDGRWGLCANKIFHLSVPPQHYEGIIGQLAVSGLTDSCGGIGGWTRVLIEKPFGKDIDTAKGLDKLLSQSFKEEQIFRIDHYLAKEAVQNIIAFRFANAIFEPLWNKEYIEAIEIRLCERLTVLDRGDFYDGVGALRDVGQNHALQLLALITMDQPSSYAPASIREARTKLIQQLEPVPIKKLSQRFMRAQYEGYKEARGVHPESQTETYFKLLTHIDSKRWSGVPIVIEAGKALKDQMTGIKVYFKPNASGNRNIVTFRLQPDEGISVRVFVKQPGFDFQVVPKNLDFSYESFSQDKRVPDAYERVILDAIEGNQTLFASTKEVDASWKFVTPLLRGLEHAPLKTYEIGSDGPDDDLTG